MLDKVEEIANNYTNGNISDVRHALSELDPTEAAHVALEIYFFLSKSEAQSFRKLLAKWNN